MSVAGRGELARAHSSHHPWDAHSKAGTRRHAPLLSGYHRVSPFRLSGSCL